MREFVIKVGGIDSAIDRQRNPNSKFLGLCMLYPSYNTFHYTVYTIMVRSQQFVREWYCFLKQYVEFREDILSKTKSYHTRI